MRANQTLGWSCFLLLVIGGLIAGFFAPSIQRSLTVSAAQVKGMGVQMPGMGVGVGTNPGTVATKPAATTVAAATPTMPPGVLASDTFQRANQALWGTASDTQIWGGDANTNGNVFSVVNGTGQIANGQGTFNAVLGMPGANMEVVASGAVNHFVGDSNKVNFGVVLRWSDGNDWYKALLDGNNLIVVKRVKGASMQLMSVPFQAQDGQTYSLRFRAIGAMIFARAWLSSTTEPTAWMITTSDTDLATGQGGVRVLVQNTSIVLVYAFLESQATSSV